MRPTLYLYLVHGQHALWVQLTNGVFDFLQLLELLVMGALLHSGHDHLRLVSPGFSLLSHFAIPIGVEIECQHMPW